MSTVTFVVGVQVPNPPDGTEDLAPPKIWVGLVDGYRMERIQEHTLWQYDWVNDELEDFIRQFLFENYSVGGCHGWVKKYESPVISPDLGKIYEGGGHFTVYEYDFDAESDTVPVGDVMDKIALCPNCREVYYKDNGHKCTLVPFQDESEKRAEDWTEAGNNG